MGAKDAEDIVQEMYLKLGTYASEDKVIRNGQISKGYIYRILQNCIASFYRVENNYCELLSDIEEQDEEDREYELLAKEVKRVLEDGIGETGKGSEYYNRIYELYVDVDSPETHSYRSMAKEIGIHHMTIYLDFAKIKAVLKERIDIDKLMDVYYDRYIKILEDERKQEALRGDGQTDEEVQGMYEEE